MLLKQRSEPESRQAYGELIFLDHRTGALVPRNDTRIGEALSAPSSPW